MPLTPALRFSLRDAPSERRRCDVPVVRITRIRRLPDHELARRDAGRDDLEERRVGPGRRRRRQEARTGRVLRRALCKVVAVSGAVAINMVEVRTVIELDIVLYTSSFLVSDPHILHWKCPVGLPSRSNCRLVDEP